MNSVLVNRFYCDKLGLVSLSRSHIHTTIFTLTQYSGPCVEIIVRPEFPESLLWLSSVKLDGMLVVDGSLLILS